MRHFSIDSNREYLLDITPQSLKYDPVKDYTSWKSMVKNKLVDLLGDIPEKTPLNIEIEYELKFDLFKEIRFLLTAESYADIPCHLLLPKGHAAPFPVVICLQGHTSGMHISLGRIKHEGDEASIKGGRDFGIQAVKEGYAALIIEQRCFGERNDLRGWKSEDCRQATLASLLLGRTMIGERVWDISRAIDALAHFPEIDRSRIGCMGNSGGGTIAYYAACMDERIGIAMPSCSICSFKDSIARIYHCSCNYIPGILKYFDMDDLACLIAPRPLVVVAGRDDPIFPLKGVFNAFDTIRQIYAAANAVDNCRLIIGEGGHGFYPEQSWPVFRELAPWN